MSHRSLIVFSLTCALAWTCAARAALPLRVDINPDNGRSDARSKGWQDWRAGGKQETYKSDGVTVSFRAVGAKKISIDMWKGGYDSGATLASDGLVAQGGGVEMVVSGLPAGRVGIATYHNIFADEAPAPFSVALNGDVKLRGVTPTKRIANDYDAATAFVEVNAEA